MTARRRRLLRDVHALATRYHWSEEAILRLPIPRRSEYLALLELDDEQGLFGALDG